MLKAKSDFICRKSIETTFGTERWGSGSSRKFLVMAKLQSEQEKQVRYLWDEGWSYRKIASKLQIDIESVRQILEPAIKFRGNFDE